MVNQVGQFSLSNLPTIKADAYKRHILQKANAGDTTHDILHPAIHRELWKAKTGLL
jgi:hypothetical protein